MKKKIFKYLLRVKFFFLCISVVFLIRGYMHTDRIETNGAEKIFTLDRGDPDFEKQINDIDTYLNSTTGLAVGLAMITSGDSTLIIPPTQDYELYKTYLHAIATVDQHNETPPLPGDREMGPHNSSSSSSNFALMVVFMLLALFL